jgi:menaquinone-dependent protoporphyrinogen oxidase
MAKVLVVYGSRHGGTQGIAERIGEVLTSEGLEARVESAEHVRDIGAPDAVVIGSGVYMGRWLDAPVTFVERHAAELASRPVWLFSSGPVPSGSAPKEEADHMEAFGPAEGPGSGGRKKLDELIALTHPRGHKVFLGAFDPDDPPKAMSERLARMLPAVKKILPTGDFREWPVIEAWAREIAAAIKGVPVPA